MTQAVIPVQAPAGPQPLLEIAHGVLASAWRRRYAIFLPILLLPVLGSVVGHYAPRSFEAKMSILIQEPGKLNPFLEDLAVKTNLKDRMAALQALLTSRYVMIGVAEDLGLLDKNASVARQDQVVSDLSGAVTVQLIGTEMVELRYRSREASGMAKALTRIGERFMERVEAPENSSMHDSVTFLGGQLKEATDKLAVAEQSLSDFKSSYAQQLPDLRGANVQRLTQLSDTLAQREVELSGAEAQLTSTVDRMSQTDPVVGRLEQDIVGVRSELALLKSRYTDQHSSVQAAERKLQRLVEERDELLHAAPAPAPGDANRMINMASVAGNRTDGSQPLLVSQASSLEAARSKVEQLRSEVANLRTLVTELRARVESSGEVERLLHDKEREVQVTSDLVAQLRRRFDMAKVTGDLSRFQAPQRIAVIDRPVDPVKPTQPITLLFGVGGLFGGIFLGIGIAVLMEMMDGTVRTGRAMQKLTGVPVLARIAPLERRFT